MTRKRSENRVSERGLDEAVGLESGDVGGAGFDLLKV